MTLSPGARLGTYEITTAIGAGGMGEVFRAKDTRLGREAAIKVLPAAFAQDPERLARFEREARVLASLNHTNIAHVYGFENSTLADGTTVHFLAMEMVEGEDLAARMKRGAIPIDESIAIARQIAEGLEEAHEHGIVHRDLKPANIKLTPDGKVKVLDFGLAKAYESNGPSSAPDVSHSPTMSRHATEAGMIMGTAAYMSPEQARGKTVDKRADIWAFGVVLFEMLTGERLFAGDTVSDTLASVLKDAPRFAALPQATPSRLRRLIERCLERDIKIRLRDIGEARVEMAKIEAGAPESGSIITAATAASSTTKRRLAPLLIATAVIAVIGALGLSRWLAPREAPTAAIAHVSVARNGLYVMRLNGERTPRHLFPQPAGELNGQVSPDGKWIAYEAAVSSRSEIYVSAFPSPGPRHQVSTDGGVDPLWSRDGRELFFGEGDRLMAVSVAKGAAFTAGAPHLVYEGRFLRSTNNRTSWSVLPDGRHFLRIRQVQPERPVTRIDLVLNWFEEVKAKVPGR